jgi:hypothetical protein
MNKSKALIISSGLGTIVFLAIFIVFFGNKLLLNDTQTTSTSNNQVTVETNQSTSNNLSSGVSYKDGSYTTDGSYTSPAGQESIKVKLTLANGIVTDTEVTSLATNSRSIQFQNRFKSGINEKVVGKKLDDISVSEVNGSSLTGNGFNQAIASIKKTAKS